jgi:2-methylisocitrate lyase-like PEP mutase family enzyme
MGLLDDPTYTVVHAPPASEGVAWLRATVVRFSEGATHLRRRDLVETLLARVDPSVLQRSGAPVANLAAALGLAPTADLVADVATVARSYQPHTVQAPEADSAVERLVETCGGRWDEATAARICLLVQCCDATTAMIAGASPPVASTRRIAPHGEEVHVDLAATPFGSGRHACPGREHALALVDGALAFRRLHHGSEPLVLPNAWDVASAAAFVAAGFTAVGTTSLGVAAVHGRPDAAGATRDETLALARRLADLPVPVTVDIEAGFGAAPGALAAELSAFGIAGVNIEDGRGDELADPADHATIVRGLKAGAPELFVNARVDTYWLDTAHDQTLERAQRYIDAGADGIFVPGVTDAAEIERLATALPVPLNVLAQLPLPQLAELGVSRISMGSLPYRASLDAAIATARRVRSGEVVTTGVSYADVQRLM